MQTHNKKHNLSICQYSHHFKRWYFLLGIALLCLSSFSLSAQNISSASIDENVTNRLTVTFNEPITVSNADGFRLVGGVARIESLLSGSGSNTLTFALTDHVLPDDAFRLLHWPEMSDARGSSGKLGEIDQVVTENVNSYEGNGELYYVSTSGNNNNTGTSKGDPLRTVGAAEAKASPGDFILLKRGDSFNAFRISKSGNEQGGSITYATYGNTSNPQPYISGDEYDGTPNNRRYVSVILVDGQDYITIDNLHFAATRSGISVVQTGDQVVISNCTIEGITSQATQSGIDFPNVENQPNRHVNPQILNNTITGFRRGIHFSGYPYRGNYEVEGGAVENNTVQQNREEDQSDGLVANRGNFRGLVFRKNDVSGYFDDGIDIYVGSNVIIEYNVFHNPSSKSANSSIDDSRSGNGIKAGGIVRSVESSQYTGTQSSNVVVRYNIVRDIRTNECACNGIVTNSGTDGNIYGNLIYDVDGHGIKVDGQSNNWNVYNNTVVGAIESGFQIFVDANVSGSVTVKNNIFEGNPAISIGQNTGNLTIERSNNVSVDNSSFSKTALFQDHSNNNYRLKDNSPAINAGSTNTPPYDQDIRGFLVDSNPDTGAYEFGDQFGPVDPNPDPNTTNVWLEAECANTIGSAWETISDGSASQDSYLKVKPGNSSFQNAPTASNTRIVFNFSVAQTGQYKIFTRHLSFNGDDDSFWVQVNNGLWVRAYLGANRGSFVWAQLGNASTYAMSEGTNTITIALREPNARLDKLFITLNGNQPTGEGDNASNCINNPPPQPVVAADAGSDRTVSLGSTVQLYGRGIGSNPFRGYLWEKVSGPSLTLNARGANATLTNLQVGTYVMRFTATDSEGNSGSDEMTLTVTGSNARTASTTKAHSAAENISEIAQSTLSAYPNPANGSITVKLPNGDQQPGVLTLTDISGKVVHRQVVNDAETVSSLSISAERIKEGMYLLRWQQENKQQTFKLFVNH